MGASIRGTVKDGQGRPLASVKVVAAHEPTGSLFAKVTGNDGQFLFQDIRAGGPYALRASRDDLVTVQDRLQIKTEEAVDFDITMVPITQTEA